MPPRATIVHPRALSSSSEGNGSCPIAFTLVHLRLDPGHCGRNEGRATSAHTSYMIALDVTISTVSPLDNGDKQGRVCKDY